MAHRPLDRDQKVAARRACLTLREVAQVMELRAQFLAWLLMPLWEGVRRPAPGEGPPAARRAVWTGKQYTCRALERMRGGLMRSAWSPAVGAALVPCYYPAWYAPAEEDPPREALVYHLGSPDKRLWTPARGSCGPVDGPAVPCGRPMFLPGRPGPALYRRTSPGDVQGPAGAGEVIDDGEAAVGRPVGQVIGVDRAGVSLPFWEALAVRGTALVMLGKLLQVHVTYCK